MTQFKTIAYLARGNARQRRAYRALQSPGIFRILRAYTPILAGTIPLNIDIRRSDLDIICEARDLDAFTRAVTDAFGAQPRFRIKRKSSKGVESVIANFAYTRFPIEIFGQPKPVREQNAYRHMVVEARLLQIGGERTRRAIRTSSWCRWIRIAWNRSFLLPPSAKPNRTGCRCLPRL